MPHTSIEKAASAMDEQAYPGLSVDEIKAARAKRVTPFDGELKAHSYLQDIELPTYIPRRGTAHDLVAPVVELPPLSVVEAAKQLKAMVEAAGGEWSGDRYRWLQQRYPEGVPQDALDTLAAELVGPRAGFHAPLRAAAGGE